MQPNLLRRQRVTLKLSLVTNIELQAIMQALLIKATLIDLLLRLY
jgi:hypothetical protein